MHKLDFNKIENGNNSNNSDQISPKFKSLKSLEFDNSPNILINEAKAKAEKDNNKLINNLERILDENLNLEDYENFPQHRLSDIISSPAKNFLSDIGIEENKFNLNYNKNNDLNNLNINEDLKSMESGAFIPGECLNSESKNVNTKTKEKGGILFDSVKERKSYEEKVNILRTRLKKLKEQEDELNKKFNQEKQKLNKVEKIRDNVNEDKKRVLIEKQQRMKESEQLKKQLLIEREKRKEKLIEAKETVKKEKEKKFNMIRKDKIVLNSLAESVKIQTDNMKSYNYYKNKQEEISSKVQRFQKYKEKEDLLKDKFNSKIVMEKNKTFDLKKKLEELEELEVQYIKRLETTIIRNRNEFENMEKVKGFNSSTIGLKIKQDILQKSETQSLIDSPNKCSKIQEIKVKNSIEEQKENINQFSMSDEKVIKNSSGKKNSSASYNNSGNTKIKIKVYELQNKEKFTSKTPVLTNGNKDKIKTTASNYNSTKSNFHNFEKSLLTKKNENKFRKNNSISVLERNSKYNTINHTYKNNIKENNENIINFQSSFKIAESSKLNCSLKSKIRKNASMDESNYKTNAFRKNYESKFKIGNSLDFSSNLNNTENTIKNIAKKINFDEKPKIEKKIIIKK